MTSNSTNLFGSNLGNDKLMHLQGNKSFFSNPNNPDLSASNQTTTNIFNNQATNSVGLSKSSTNSFFNQPSSTNSLINQGTNSLFGNINTNANPNTNNLFGTQNNLDPGNLNSITSFGNQNNNIQPLNAFNATAGSNNNQSSASGFFNSNFNPNNSSSNNSSVGIFGTNNYPSVQLFPTNNSSLFGDQNSKNIFGNNIQNASENSNQLGKTTFENTNNSNLLSNNQNSSSLFGNSSGTNLISPLQKENTTFPATLNSTSNQTGLNSLFSSTNNAIPSLNNPQANIIQPNLSSSTNLFGTSSNANLLGNDKKSLFGNQSTNTQNKFNLTPNIDNSLLNTTSSSLLPSSNTMTNLFGTQNTGFNSTSQSNNLFSSTDNKTNVNANPILNSSSTLGSLFDNKNNTTTSSNNTASLFSNTGNSLFSTDKPKDSTTNTFLNTSLFNTEKTNIDNLVKPNTNLLNFNSTNNLSLSNNNNNSSTFFPSSTSKGLIDVNQSFSKNDKIVLGSRLTVDDLFALHPDFKIILFGINDYLINEVKKMDELSKSIEIFTELDERLGLSLNLKFEDNQELLLDTENIELIVFMMKFQIDRLESNVKNLVNDYSRLANGMIVTPATIHADLITDFEIEQEYLQKIIDDVKKRVNSLESDISSELKLLAIKTVLDESDIKLDQLKKELELKESELN